MKILIKISLFALLFAFSGCCSEPLEPLTPVVSGNPMRVTDSSWSYGQTIPNNRIITLYLNDPQDDSSITSESVIVTGMSNVVLKSYSNDRILTIEGIANNCSYGNGDLLFCSVQVTLKGTGKNLVKSQSNTPLDGDNDNIEGGDYVEEFIF